MQLLKPSMAEECGPIAEAEILPEPLEDVKHLAPIERQFASISSRFFAVLIDMILIGFLMVSLFLISPFNELRRQSSTGFIILLLVTYLTLLFLYHTLSEGTKGTTVGKWLVGIKVVKEDLRNVNINDSAIRNVLRIVDAFPFFAPYLLGAVVIRRRENRQRVGDLAARTVVINV
jgi:uncharacterized RDD family membrane protein YckC